MSPAERQRELQAVRHAARVGALLAQLLVIADGATSDGLAPVASASTALNQWRREEFMRLRDELRALDAARDAETTASLRAAVDGAGAAVRALSGAQA